MINAVVAEVKDFLSSLKGEFPELFKEKTDKRHKDEALRIFSERVAHWSATMGVSYNSVRIKDQKSLWGSCSAKGNLNFNWRVIHAPPEVLDYLVIHELSHLLEMNHSSRFWGHVAAWSPDYRSHRRWLRDNSARLKRLRASPRPCPAPGTDIYSPAAG